MCLLFVFLPDYTKNDKMMIFIPTKYELQTVATGRVFSDEGWTLDDKQCDKPSMVRPVYEKKQLEVKEGACLG